MRPPGCKRARIHAVRYAKRYRESTIYCPLIVQECIVGQLVLWECEEVRGCEWNASRDIRLRLPQSAGLRRKCWEPVLYGERVR